MPTHAASNQAIQQMYINGHFCYAYKFGIITNGLGIVRDITFYNRDFLKAHPDIVVGKKSDSPDEDKSLADSKALLPVLVDFFQKHPLIAPKTCLGDAAFDTINIYKSLFEEIGFQKAFIHLKTKLSVEGIDYTVNENSIPCCPHDSSLPMKRKEASLICEASLNVEKSINHFKDSFCIANRKTQNEKTLHADLLLAGITQLVTVLVADKNSSVPIHSEFEAFDCLIFHIHTIFSSQFIWEVFWSCPYLETPTFHLKNSTMQDSYRIFYRDCELVSQLLIICF